MNGSSEMQEFLNLNFTPVPKSYISLLDIAGFSHHEDVITNIYAWFLDPGAGHGMEGLVLDSLLKLIQANSEKQFRGKAKKAIKQVVLKDSRKRIDLIINGEDENGEWDIIIENKIYHHLNNDLQAYFGFSSLEDKRKCGILLTLKPHHIPPETGTKFINIIHRDWIENIKNNLSGYSCDRRYEVYLSDLMNTIEKLTIDHTMNKFAQTYFANANKINTLIEYKQKANEFIVGQIEQACSILRMRIDDYTKEHSFRYIYEEDCGDKMYYTVFYDNLFSNNYSIRIVLEFWKENHISVSKIENALLESFKVKPSAYFPGKGFEYLKENTKNYTHYLTREYLLDESQLEKLGEQIASFIQRDFAEEYNLIKGIV
jgi:hypothetical protein